tara:strand:- start:133 stop:714 length:582 start_codon:yes stop_codon:yes gene_type:complete
MSIKDLSKPLRVDQIEFRVQSITGRGKAIILVYKDARADMQVLDSAVGPLNWKREHSQGNHNCTVSIWCDEKKQWVSKEDVGTESNTEKEKGLASDSFKRACFNWGIGRELYDYPFIKVDLNGGLANKWDNEWEPNGQKGKQAFGLKLKEWAWFSQFNEQNKLICLVAKDQKGKQRFTWGKFNKELYEAQKND